MEAVSHTRERRSERVSATIPISLLMQREDTRTEHEGWMVDISPHGARVRSAYVLFAGQIVGITAAGDAARSIPYRVVWVKPSSSGCLAGLASLETTPD
jgi:PilZ domain